jgi:hypothetical protein
MDLTLAASDPIGHAIGRVIAAVIVVSVAGFVWRLVTKTPKK